VRWETPSATDGLSPRDVEVLRLISEGYRVAAIAQRLCYSESTVKKAIHDLMVKVGARNQTHAVAIAIRSRVI